MEPGSPGALGNGSVLGSFPKPQGNGSWVRIVGFGAGPGAERGVLFSASPLRGTCERRLARRRAKPRRLHPKAVRTLPKKAGHRAKKTQKNNKTRRHGSKLAGSHLGDDGVEAALSPRVVPRVGVQHPTPIWGGGNSKELLQPPKNQPRGFADLTPAATGVSRKLPGAYWANWF